MKPKVRKAVEVALTAAETVYQPYFGEAEEANWKQTLEAMERLRRAVKAARKALAENDSDA